MKLTERIVASVTLHVIGVIFVLFIGGAISFNQLSTDFLSHYLHRVVKQIDEASISLDAAKNIEIWLPHLLKASDVVELEIRSHEGLLFQYQQIAKISDAHTLIEDRFDLTSNPGFFVTTKSLSPYANFSYSIEAMFSLALAIFIIILGVVFGVFWLKKQLHGADVLSQRARLILVGRTDEAMVHNQVEWPNEASAAFDFLLLELKEARQERCRFDTFLRTNMFLDKLTGMANRVLFDNRLQAKLHDQGAYGALLLLGLNDWDELKHQLGEKERDVWVMQIVDLLSRLTLGYSDVVLARYYDDQFAILLINHSTKSAKQFAAKLMKNLEKCPPLNRVSIENWASIGVAFFTSGESQETLTQEAEMAKRSAYMTGANAWHAYEKNHVVDDMRGSVRWRTLLERVFSQNAIEISEQQVLDQASQPLHIELLARIKDERGVQIKASSFMQGVHLVGMNVQLDTLMLRKVLSKLKQGGDEQIYAVNICSASLTRKPFCRWLRESLFELPRKLRKRLLIEMTESSLVRDFGAIRGSLNLLTHLGVGLVIDQAGRTIVSTHYIKDVQPSYIKLHRSLVKDIHQRPENQVYIRSMLGACESTQTQVLAIGVETESEWLALLNIGVNGGAGKLFSPKIIEPQIKLKRQRWKRA